MELSAARVTLLVLLLGFLCGGGVVAVRDCESTTTTFPVRGAANQLAAAAAAAEDDCTTHSAHVSTGGGTAAAGPTCDASLMASQLTQLCRIETDAPGALCCATVLLTVEQDTNCLCRVADAAEFDVSDLSVAQVWEWYKSCGGRRSVPRDEDSCEPGSPPPPAAKPEAPSASPLRLWLAVGLLCAAAVATAVFAGLRLWLPRTHQ
ncbi:non-specific lipid-transfer protein EPAD1-like isoform X2 [Miscanthus floridulus]|uniref:non-specific lipid-transfer protein EPAD1-like isoform X2 n=1 Tax=Miscanthus floridulus TaxID=154761 RepID=UPI0034577789